MIFRKKYTPYYVVITNNVSFLYSLACWSSCVYRETTFINMLVGVVVAAVNKEGMRVRVAGDLWKGWEGTFSEGTLKSYTEGTFRVMVVCKLIITCLDNHIFTC